MALRFKGSSAIVLPDISLPGDFTINLPTIEFFLDPEGDAQAIIANTQSSSFAVGFYGGGGMYINVGGNTEILPTALVTGDIVENAILSRSGSVITLSCTKGSDNFTTNITSSMAIVLDRLGDGKESDRPLQCTLSGQMEIIRDGDTTITYDFDTEVTEGVLTDITSGQDVTYGSSIAEFIPSGTVVKQVTFDLPSQMQGVSGLYYLVTSVPLGASILNGEDLDTSATTFNMSLTSVDGIAIGMPLMLIATDKLEATDASDIIGWSVATVTGE